MSWPAHAVFPVMAAALISCGEKPGSQPDETAASEAQLEAGPGGAERRDPDSLPGAEPVAGEIESVPATEVDPAPGVPAGGLSAGRTEPFLLEDFAQIKVRDGASSPEIGDTIHSMGNLPENACGTYWVMGADGYVEMLAVCTGDHSH